MKEGRSFLHRTCRLHCSASDHTTRKSMSTGVWVSFQDWSEWLLQHTASLAYHSVSRPALDMVSNSSNQGRQYYWKVGICRTKRNVPNRVCIRDLFVVVLPSDSIFSSSN